MVKCLQILISIAASGDISNHVERNHPTRPRPVYPNKANQRIGIKTTEQSLARYGN